MEPPTEIPKKKLKLDGITDGVGRQLKELDDDVVSIESSTLGEDRRILCQVSFSFRFQHGIKRGKLVLVDKSFRHQGKKKVSTNPISRR